MQTFYFTCLFKSVIIFTLYFLSASLTQLTFAQVETSQPIALNSKAKELGITQGQLNGILNSIKSNGEKDPSPETMQQRFFTGQAAGDVFGTSVSNAGDVNGDGFDDMLVGAPYNDAGGTAAGRAYIYFGGAIMDNTADVILTGSASGDHLGNSVSTSGDVNGDGFSDVIVGAYTNDAGGTDAGRAYIYFGGVSMDNIADVIITGAVGNDQFGISVSEAGDVNGDGYGDVVVGAHYNDLGGADAGTAYIYFGGTNMNNIADVILIGESVGDYFGFSVSTAGDVNGDGFSDVIVGAYTNDAGGTDAGRAYIFWGSAYMNNTADLILTGEGTGDLFGNSVSTAGDVNGDGYSDVIVGAFWNDAAGSLAGRAYVYFGGAIMNTTEDVILTGEATVDNFGNSVSTAGDVNGDGYDDVIVGALYNDAIGADAGRAYVYFGNENMDNISDVILTGEAAGDWFGNSVSSAGDVNGDGYKDIIVGGPSNDAGGSNAGKAYLYTNSLSGTDIPDEFFTGEADSDNFGYSVSTAGDVNGDGYDDMIVGATGNDTGGNAAGGSYIFFGGESMDNIADLILIGEAEGDQFGCSVSTAGDVNGDGYSDVIVGAVYNDAVGLDVGRAYVYFGGIGMDNTADVILTGEAVSDNFGYSVSIAGDVNGDGYSDVIVGARYNGANAGRAYIYFGGISMDNIADVILTGEYLSDYFGHSVSAAGDMNKDGYGDVIVGAIGNDAGGMSAGRAYLYFGGSSMDNIADVVLTGEAAGDYFGCSVSEVSDINADGYSDLVVGANGNDAGGPDAGRAYIYFGGLVVDNIADVILTGKAAGDRLGYSVSTSGDVNGDGYGDVIVGAFGNDAGGFAAGRAYIYFGRIAMNNTADVILTGEGASDWFGLSVSVSGDVNGDGYSDVIVGAPQNDAAGTDAGRAYLYLSSSPPIKPCIMSVKDVPFDQGGQVFVNFVRSGYDAIGESNIITEYLIEMSNPPGVNGFSWWQAGTVQPVQNPLYTFIANTPNDSMINNSGTYYFRVTARTANPNEYWRSNVMYGHSVDNLAPLPPGAFYAVTLGEDVKLGWQTNTEPDLKNYVLYRTDYPNANPDTLEVFAEVWDTIYVDTDPLTGNAYYYLRSQDIHNNLSQAVEDSIIEQTTFSLSVLVSNGWNMVSVPGINPDGMGVDTWWINRDPLANVFYYAGGYQSTSTTTPGTGYWMKHSGDQTYNTGDEWPAGGIQIVAHDPITAASGWNLFGGYELSVGTGGLQTNPPGLITGSVYKYSGGYQVAATLDPGYGYWVKLTGAGDIIIPEVLAKGIQEEEFFKKEWGRIVLTDATGINYTLYAVKGASPNGGAGVDLDQYELPPAPPEGMFDIRFSSGRIAEDINSSVKEIDMSGVTYPLTVKAENMDIRLMDETGKIVNLNLKKGEDVVISDPTIQKLMVTGELIPDKYALEQNYPNPFNPSTVIEFSLPEDVSNVKLTIYNVLGEKVAELVNTLLIAGKYKYQWNASNVATGIYIYELRTDKFNSIKKMILLK